MEKFFLSRKAQVASGAIVGFVLGITLKNAIVAFVGPKLFVAFTSGMGLLVVSVIVLFAIFVALTVSARGIRRFNSGGHN